MLRLPWFSMIYYVLKKNHGVVCIVEMLFFFIQGYTLFLFVTKHHQHLCGCLAGSVNGNELKKFDLRFTRSATKRT